MTEDLFYGLVIIIIVLSDIMIWLRAARLPQERRSGQIFAGIIFALVAVVLLYSWMLIRIR